VKTIRVMSKGQIQENEVINTYIVNYFDLGGHSIAETQKFAIGKNATIEKAHQLGRILEVEANDVEITEENIKKSKDKNSYPIKLFNLEEAKRVVDFIESHKDSDFVFQCDFGRSRSLTTAVFAQKYILQEHEILVRKQFIYNKSVYRLLARAYLFPNKTFD